MGHKQTCNLSGTLKCKTNIFLSKNDFLSAATIYAETFCREVEKTAVLK